MRVALMIGVLLVAAAKGEVLKSELGTMEPSVSTQALNGRIAFRLPQGTNAEARQRSIMAAPESAEEETRFVIDAGKERLVVMVNELFALAPKDLIAAMKTNLGAQSSSWEVTPLGVADTKMRAVHARPLHPALEGDATLVEAAYYVLPDNTVVHGAAYANPDAFANLEGVRTLARKIMASPTSGIRTLDRRAGTRKLGRLMITVPADMVLSLQRGADFDVYRLRPLVTLGGPAPARLSVYLGSYPRYQHEQRGIAQNSVIRIKGTLLGRDAEWHRWSMPDGSRTLEVIGPLSGQETLAHVFVSTKSEIELDVMRKVAETLTLTR